MKLEVISTNPLALKQQTGNGQHNPRPVSCYSPEPDHMFSLQPRVPAVGRKTLISQKLKTEERKPTSNMQASFKLLEALLVRKSFASPSLWENP
jgi:hypothetical protein